jgi:hypothetical protein
MPSASAMAEVAITFFMFDSLFGQGASTQRRLGGGLREVFQKTPYPAILVNFNTESAVEIAFSGGVAFLQQFL